jgi:hypothetical protein
MSTYDPPRPHRLFVVNADKAQCMDCRRDFSLPHLSVHKEQDMARWTDDQWMTYHRQRMALLVPDFGITTYTKVGYCNASRRLYYNPTQHTLNLSGLGIPEIKPGEIFELGKATSSLVVRKYASQIKALEDIKRYDTGLDLLPLTIDEAIKYTTTLGNLHAGLSFTGA